MPKPTRLVTADELERMPEDDYRYELVRGRLVRMSPAAPRHGHCSVAVSARLWQHVRQHNLGQVWTEVGFLLFSDPDTVRAPDVAFVRQNRLPPRDARGFFRGAPDLAIEVLSPDDRPGEVQGKVEDYLAAGAPRVVLIDPDARQVVIHQPGAAAVTPGASDALDLDPIISSFRIPVAELFD
jgi:Uma2 family endonuclease